MTDYSRKFEEIVTSAVVKLTHSLDAVLYTHSEKGRIVFNFKTSSKYDSAIKNGLIELMHDLQEVFSIKPGDMVEIIQRINKTTRYPSALYKPLRFGSRKDAAKNRFRYINYQKNPFIDDDLDDEEQPHILENLSAEDYAKFYVSTLGAIFRPENKVFYLQFKNSLPKHIIQGREDISSFEALQSAARLAIITALILENIRRGLVAVIGGKKDAYLNKIFTTPIVLLFTIFESFSGSTSINFYDNINFSGLM